MARRSMAVGMVVIALATGASACGSSDVSKAKFASELDKTTPLSKAQARCVADRVFTTFDQSEINSLYREDKQEDLDKGTVDGFSAIVKRCRAG